jgi:hypothetical protein
MKPVEWAKHVVVFIAAVFLIWLGGVMPSVWPKLNSGGDPFAGLPAPTLMGLLSAWPIYIALVIVQALTFHYVKKFSTPIFLGGVFVAALLFAMRYSQLTAG